MAEAIGIEQSYLSRLENDKSLPSNDVFVRILEVFGLDIADVMDDLDQSSRKQLRALPDVADHYHRQKQLIIGNRQRWLLGSAIMLALGAAFICAGNVHLFLLMSSINIYRMASSSTGNRRRFSDTHRGPSPKRFRAANRFSFGI